MRALAAAGRQADALAAYAEGRELLADRLGVDPSPRLEQAHLAVLRQEIPLAVPAGTAAWSSRTYAAVSGTFRRSRPVASACPPRSARRPASSAGTTTSPACSRSWRKSGSSPSPAPAASARRGSPQKLPPGWPAWRGGPAWFAELAPVSDPSEVPYAVLDALGLRERVIARHGADQAYADPADRLCAALGDREAVLILDNCEHLIEAAASLADRLLTDCPRTRIIATSREPLRIPGETL